MWLLLGSIGVCFVFARLYLPFQEKRTDVVRLNDFILEWFPNADLSNLLQVLIVAAPAACNAQMWSEDSFFSVEKFWAKYALTNVFKMLTLYVTPLDKPKGYTPLVDCVSCHFMGKSETYGKDLFFSGHTALASLCVLHASSNFLFFVLIVNFAVVVVALCVNRVHYTIDIIVAPFVAYGCHRMIDLWFDP